MMQPDDSISAYHILPVLLPDKCDRLEVINALKEKKIQTSIHYPPFGASKLMNIYFQ